MHCEFTIALTDYIKPYRCKLAQERPATAFIFLSAEVFIKRAIKNVSQMKIVYSQQKTVPAKDQ